MRRSSYVLGSLTEDEIRQIEDHVAGCDLHAEIAGLAAVTMGLAAAGPEAEPPSGFTGLGERISAAIRADQNVPHREIAPITGTPIDGSVSPRTASSRPESSRTLRFASWPVAAALAVALGALLVWNVALQMNDPGGELVHFFREEDGDWVRVEATLGESNATVSLGGFEPLPSSRDYQLWAVRNDAAISLGVFETGENGRWSGDIDFALERGDGIAITEETAGGSDAPTAEPLLSTQL